MPRPVDPPSSSSSLDVLKLIALLYFAWEIRSRLYEKFKVSEEAAPGDRLRGHALDGDDRWTGRGGAVGIVGGVGERTVVAVQLATPAGADRTRDERPSRVILGWIVHANGTGARSFLSLLRLEQLALKKRLTFQSGCTDDGYPRDNNAADELKGAACADKT